MSIYIHDELTSKSSSNRLLDILKKYFLKITAPHKKCKREKYE
ncbi:hypothetical protein B4064_3313 [Caldibacillus thermoamylovorans]|nr:hypothetical protein B4064_3313 [Caldibacillus thermoamylovorans]